MSKKLVAAIAVFGLLTAACELRADLRLELNADQSGTVLVTFGLDEEFQALVEAGDQPIDESLFGADNPLGELPGAATRTYEDDGFTYYEASVPFTDLNGLRLLGVDADNFLNEFDIRFDDETARVSGNLDLGELTGGDLADDSLAGIGAEALAEIFKFHIQIDMPGKVTEQNADRVLADGTLEWDIPLTGESQSLRIAAESSLTNGGGIPDWLIVIIVLVVAAVAVFLFRLRRGGRSAPSTTPSPPADQPEPSTPKVTEMSDLQPDPPAEPRE